MTDNKIKLFESQHIRAQWDEDAEKWPSAVVVSPKNWKPKLARL